MTIYESKRVFDLLRGSRPALILVDVRMENSDSGWHLLELLQADPTTALIPLVVCSADQLQLEEREGWLCQRDMRFLLKPFDLDELDALLDDLLSSRSMGLGASES